MFAFPKVFLGFCQTGHFVEICLHVVHLFLASVPLGSICSLASVPQGLFLKVPWLTLAAFWFPFGFLLSNCCSFWHPFGSMLVAVGTLLIQFLIFV